jgi:predicted AAA+ superfamily ATPase
VKAGNVFLSPSDRGPRFWFVDEISSVEGAWPQEIKWLRDNDPAFRTDTIVLTGSSSAHLDEAIKALAGRRGDATNTDRTLLPMSFTDFCAALGVGGWPRPPELTPPDLRTAEAYEAIHAILPWMADLITTWETYLHIGGYPQAVASWITDRDVTPALIAALWDVVHGEAITARRFSGAQTSRLLSELTRNLCSPLNVADLARDLDVARATAEARIADLCRTYLVWPLHRSDGLTPSLRSQTKYYFTDPLLARLAAARGGGTPPSLPQLNQQQVGLALQRHIDRQMPGTFARCDEILYYRSKTGAEIDFVGRRLQPVVVESKYVDDKWGRELQTIKASGWHGVIASRSGVDVGPTATVMPSPVLAILLGS